MTNSELPMHSYMENREGEQIEMYHVLTIQLTGLSKKDRGTLAKENPKGRRSTPFATVAYTKNETKLKSAKKGDFSGFSKWAKKGSKLLPEHCKPAKSKLEALKLQREKVAELRAEGWRVRFFNPVNRRVYVIRLKESVWEKSKKFRKQNHDEKYRFKGYLYVGETEKTVEERFLVHTTKPSENKIFKGSDIVFDHHKEIAYDLMKDLDDKLYDQYDSLIEEDALANRLRNKGFAVYSA